MELMRVIMGAHRSDLWCLWALTTDACGGLMAAPFENT